MPRSQSHIDVLHITEACGGGVAQHIRHIVPQLLDSGFKCAVCGFGQRISDDFKEDLKRFKDMGCETDCWHFNHGNAFGTFRYVFHLKNLLAKWNPSVIHAHATIAGVAARIAKGAAHNAKLVYSPHAFAFHPTLPWKIRETVRFLEQCGARRTDAYAFVGRSEIQDANNLELPPDRFHLIENGLPETFNQTLLDRNEARAKLNIKSDEHVAVIPCRLVKQKGLDQVINIIPHLKDDCSKIRFMFCGEGPEKNALLALAQKLGVQDRITFTGEIEQLHRMLPAFDLAILPSLYEGLSYVLLECLASGIPLIVSDIFANVPRPELRDILHTFTIGDLDELASHVRKTLREPNKTRERAQMGVDFMKLNFRLDNQIQKLSNLYHSLM